MLVFLTVKPELQDFGDFEYFQVQRILARVSDPDQLHIIEENCPQFKGEDAELWKAFITRDIPDWKSKNYVPKNPKDWYMVYRKYRREQKREIEEDKRRLKEAMMGLAKDKQNHVSRKVDPRTLPNLPRDPKMRPNNGGVPIGGRKRGFVKGPSSALSWAGGSKTKTNTASGVLSRARREAKEMTARNKLVQPTHQLGKQQVLKAPKGMVNEYRKAAEPPLRIHTPKRKLGTTSYDHNRVSGPSLEERERRLRALTQPKRDEPGTGHVTIVDSDSEGEDDGAEDLFDESYLEDTSPPPKRASYQVQETRHRPSPATARLPHSSSIEKLPAPPKPSDVISSLISNSRSQLQAEKPSAAPSHPHPSPPKSMASATAPHHATASPMRTSSSASGQMRPMIAKRKAPVDIFNRGGAATKKFRK